MTPLHPHRSIRPLLAVAFATLALLSPLILHHAQRAEIDASMEVFFAADQRSKGSFEKLESMMTQRIACLVLVRMDGIFSDGGARLIDELGEELMALDGVPRVFSLTRAQRPIRKPGLSLSLKDLITFEPFLPLESQSEAEWARIERLVTDYPWARDLLVSKDGRWTMLVAEVERELDTHDQRDALRQDVEGVVGPYRDRVEEIHVGSFPFIEAEVRDHIQQDVRRFLYVLPFLLAAILLVTFRSLAVLACVVLFEAAGVGFVTVLFGWNGASINTYTGIVFPLVAGLQLTFLTHFLASLRGYQRRGEPFESAFPSAFRHVLKPSAIAAMTSIIGLLSLLTCDVGLVREFGWLGAQSVLACFTITFLPSYLLVLYLGRKSPVEKREEPLLAEGVEARMAVLGPVVGFLCRHRWWVLGGTLGLVLLAVPGASRVRTDLRAIEFLSPESVSRRTMGAVDRHMGGMNLFELDVDCGKEGGIQEPGNLAFLEQLERYAESMPGVTNVYGYAQIYAMLNEIWQREKEGSRTVPQSPAMISAMGMVVHGQEFLFEESMHDANLQRTTLFIRTQDMPALRYLSILEEIVDYAETHRPEGVEIAGKQGLHSVLESDRRIVGSQVRSLLLCMLAVFATLCILWRSPRLAIVVVLVNLPPLAAVLAMHGYAAIPLNSVTVMVGAVVLGIAVDNGIHLLSFWSEGRERFGNGEESLRWVLAHKLGPMACTTAVLIAGFSLLLLSNFPPLSDFGKLSILALAVALLSTAIVMPPLIQAVFGRRVQ